jgi:hypothetical protein
VAGFTPVLKTQELGGHGKTEVVSTGLSYAFGGSAHSSANSVTWDSPKAKGCDYRAQLSFCPFPPGRPGRRHVNFRMSSPLLSWSRPSGSLKEPYVQLDVPVRHETLPLKYRELTRERPVIVQYLNVAGGRL